MLIPEELRASVVNLLTEERKQQKNSLSLIKGIEEKKEKTKQKNKNKNKSREKRVKLAAMPWEPG